MQEGSTQRTCRTIYAVAAGIASTTARVRAHDAPLALERALLAGPIAW